ncbi:MAG TPA: hypothetical protein VGO21_02380 [Candidatus Paceibacterota bacterium]|nr:hypothetical protein [Candidatus Paceibacterota bacterium]
MPQEAVQGENITVNVEVNSFLQSINAVSGIISFPQGLVSVVSLNKDNSIIKLWTQEPHISSNKISFEGVILTPGFEGTHGPILQITFRAKNKGMVYLNWNEGSILANDGYGTNVLDSLDPTSFKIISSPLHIQKKPPSAPVFTPSYTRIITPIVTAEGGTPAKELVPVVDVAVATSPFREFVEDFISSIQNWDTYLSSKIILFEDSLIKYLLENVWFTTFIAFFCLYICSVIVHEQRKKTN